MKRSLNEGNSKRMSKLECIVTTNFEMGQQAMRLEVLPLLVHGMQECGNGQEMHEMHKRCCCRFGPRGPN